MVSHLCLELPMASILLRMKPWVLSWLMTSWPPLTSSPNYFPLILSTHPGCLDVPQTHQEHSCLRAFALTAPSPRLCAGKYLTNGSLGGRIRSICWFLCINALIKADFKPSIRLHWTQVWEEVHVIRSNASQRQQATASSWNSLPTHHLLTGCLIFFRSLLKYHVSRDIFPHYSF